MIIPRISSGKQSKTKSRMKNRPRMGGGPELPTLCSSTKNTDFPIKPLGERDASNLG